MSTTVEEPLQAEAWVDAECADPVDALRGMRAAQEAQWRARAHHLVCMARFADLHRTLPDEAAALGYTLVQWGGDGVPLINEHCCLELAAFMACSEDEAVFHLGVVQAMKYRFPRLWRMVLSGRMKDWHLEHIVHLTSTLSADLAALVDEKVAGWYRHMPWKRILAMIEALVMEHDPAAARQQAEKERGQRRVNFHRHGTGETRGMEACLDTADAVFLEATIQRMADILAEGGSTDTRDVRRAKALGVLASPARALQLLQASLTDELPDLVIEGDLDPQCPAQGQRGHTCGQVTVNPDKLLPTSHLVVHLTDETVGTRHGLARVENVGPVLAEQVKTLLDSTRVIVRPVLNPGRLLPTDAYECPPLMREHLMIRNPHSVFPYSSKPSRVYGKSRVDLDHTVHWAARQDAGRNGPPPTRPDNLGPLSRRAHRGKTFGGWKLEQLKPGVFWWQSPLGFEYLVTPSFTIPLTNPARARDEEAPLVVPDQWPIPQRRRRASADRACQPSAADSPGRGDRPPDSKTPRLPALQGELLELGST